jgi:methylmalonyl-CoA/ethylmalonyl-CoA epimerase
MTRSLPTAFRGLKVTQIGQLVPDLAAAVRTQQHIFGVEEWAIYTYSPSFVPNLSYRGGPAQFSMRLALAGVDPQIELIEPLNGPSVYHEWIETHGFGVQHLGFHVLDIDVVRRRLAAEGWEPVQAGSGYGVDGDGAFAYYDTVDEIGLMLELIESPRRRRPSETL